jgi:hypothetical protein
MVRGAVAILVAVALYWPLARYLLGAVGVPPAERDRLAAQFVEPQSCRPEPGERLAFLAGVAVLPALIGAAAFAAHWLRGRRRLRLPAALVWGSELLLGAGLVALSRYALRPGESCLWSRNLLALYPRTGVILAGVTLAALWAPRAAWPRAAHALDLLAGAAIIGVALLTVFDETDFHAIGSHFNALFFPVVQVHQGKGLLVQADNQYGLFPEFLRPAFALLGLSVLKFTAVMSALMALAYAALWLFLRRAARHRLVALLGLLALAFNGRLLYLLITAWVLQGHPDPYFQVFPVRFLFPALAVGLAGWYARRPTRRLYTGALLLLGAGVLWNVDVGLPTYLAWLGLLAYGEFADHDRRTALRRAARHVGRGAAVLAGVVAAYALAAYAAYGGFPRFGTFFHYQKAFYLAGYYMLPMPWPGAWVLVVLVYLAGLAYPALALAEGWAGERARLVGFIALLGIGLFPYYQGRSHFMVLITGWWPAFLLLALYLDDLLPLLRRRPVRPLAWLAAALLVWVLAGSAASPVLHRQEAVGWLAGRFGKPRARDPWALGPDLALLRQAVPPAKEFLAVTVRQHLLHLHLGIPSASRQSLLQLVLVEDVRKLCRVLQDRPAVKVFIDRPLWEGQVSSRATQLFVALLRERYRVIGATPTGYLFASRSAPGPDAQAAR